MKRTLVFKTNAFPTISETFIVSNIVEAINTDFKVKIIVDSINAADNTSQPNLLKKHGLLNKVSKFNQPTRKLKRYLKAICFLLNPFLFYYFIKFWMVKQKKSLDYIFILKYYWIYRKATAFHVHFATAINPLFELKEIGFLKSKIVVTFHGYDEHGLPNGDLLKNVINNFNKHVSHITANTYYLKNKLVAKGFNPAKIEIVPIGIDTNFFENSKIEIVKEQPFKIITVGRFVEIKGQAFGIKAIKLLNDKGYKIKYTLIGYGEELKNLQQIAKEQNLEDTVHFEDSKNQEEIKRMLSEHHLFLMTSTSDKTKRCETFGVVSLEAQAMGLPVVGFKSGGFPETLIEGETGITVEDKNVTEMVNTIELLLNDNEKRNRMSMAAIKHIKYNFNSSITNQKYIELYNA